MADSLVDTGQTEHGIPQRVVSGSPLVPLVALAVAILLLVDRGMRWNEIDWGPTLLSERDLTDRETSTLVSRLVSRQKPVDVFIWRQFSEKTRETLKNAETSPLQLQKRVIVDELNRIIESEYSIYSESLFPEYEVPFKPIVSVRGDFTRLNRSLLAQAYSEIKGNEEDDLWARLKHELGNSVPILIQWFSWIVTEEIPTFLLIQLKIIVILGLIALLPGIAGLIYRRAFRFYFLTALVLLFAINWLFHTVGWGSIASREITDLELGFSNYLWTELLLVLFVVGWRVRRHQAIATATKFELFLGSCLAVSGGGGLIWFGWFYFTWFGVGSSVILLQWGVTILRQYIVNRDQHIKPKNIVVCLDGTWNVPGQIEAGQLAETNVCKLFRMLKGKRISGHYAASECKAYADSGGTLQIALYYYGVGNRIENSEFGQLFGGAFGLGAEAVVDRAYLDVVREYRAGDRIYIFGFSRGAAISRLLAGTIAQRGVPHTMWTLALLGRQWVLRKSAEKRETDVAVLGCWDTVGAFGIAKNLFGIPFKKIDLLKDMTVPACVRRAYHLVALDETRDAFEPTLMDPDPLDPDRIIEIWFSGDHANVGGGYATTQLSDVTLDFLLKSVSSGYAHEKGMEPGQEDWGLYLRAVRTAVWLSNGDNHADSTEPVKVDPDRRGLVRHSTGPMYTHRPRKLPMHAQFSPMVFDLIDGVEYAPQNLLDLLKEFEERRQEFKDIFQKNDMKAALGRLDLKAVTRVWDPSDDKYDPSSSLSNGRVERAKADEQ